MDNFTLDLVGYADEVLWLMEPSVAGIKVLYCNLAYERIWGRPLFELYASPNGWMDTILSDYQLISKELLSNVLENGPFEVEYQIKRPDGHIRWIRERGWPAGNNIAGISQDITEIKLIQRELKNFAYAASHDLREPLRVINGYAFMIESAVENLPPTFKYYVDHIINASKRMADMIDGLLAYSRISREDRFKPMKLKEVANLAVGNLHDAIKDADAIIKLQEMVTIEGIKGQLIQVFQNLISNSIKFSKEGVVPRIEIGIQEKDDHRVVIYIKDNGIGIKEDDHKKIFQIFKKLHSEEKFSGRGIGLSLVKSALIVANSTLLSRISADKL